MPGLKRLLYKNLIFFSYFASVFLQNHTIITKNDIWDHPYINLLFLFVFRILNKTLCITYIRDFHCTNKQIPTMFCFNSFYSIKCSCLDTNHFSFLCIKKVFWYNFFVLVISSKCNSKHRLICFSWLMTLEFSEGN